MTRRIPIQSATQSGGVGSPGSFVLQGTVNDNPAGDWTSVFRGKFYRDSIGTTQTFYLADGTLRSAPAGYQLIEATTFTVTGNPTFDGRYTVYTQKGTTADAANPSSTFAAGATSVKVNEPVPAGVVGAGVFATNISTYYLLVSSGSPIVVPPATNITDQPVELVGRNFSGWGEVFQQNLLRAVQHYAGTIAPTGPFLGQMWYDTSVSPSVMKIWDGAVWTVVNSAAFADLSSFRHTQSTPAATWTVNHNLGAAAPFIVHASFFVDPGDGTTKPILPQDVTYVTANQLTVTFSTAYAGYALIRS